MEDVVTAKLEALGSVHGLALGMCTVMPSYCYCYGWTFRIMLRVYSSRVVLVRQGKANLIRS